MNEPTATPRTVDHWSATSGLWKGPGSRAVTFHITFQDQPALHGHAEQWRTVFAPYTQLDLVPDQWLHLTTQGIALHGEVDERDIEEISAHAALHLAQLTPIDLTFAGPAFTPQAVRFEPAPAGPVAAVRTALRTAITTVLGAAPENADGFVPHVTIGYGNRDEDAGGLLTAIRETAIDPVTLTIEHVDLILLGRDEGMYTWDLLRELPLGA